MSSFVSRFVSSAVCGVTSRLLSRSLSVACVVCVAMLISSVAGAQESAGEAEPLPRFHAAGLVGESHNGELNGFTFGGDIEFRFSRLFGIGFTGEHVDQPFRENVWFVPLLIHPAVGHNTAGLKLTVAPGFERAREAAASFSTATLLAANTVAAVLTGMRKIEPRIAGMRIARRSYSSRTKSRDSKRRVRAATASGAVGWLL